MWVAVFFLLGFFVVFIPAAIIISREDKCPSNEPPQPAPRNDSDYQSNSDYYQQMTDSHDFTQMDNLRLDRLSSPRFHPTTGKSIMYLRTQYHMPDLKGSTTTLHWVDIQTNKTIQLTEPTWGIYDQQVIHSIQ